MARPDDDAAAPERLARTERHQDKLNQLGRSWFAELRDQSEREAAEFEEWRRDHRKWTVFNKRSHFGEGFPDFGSDSGD